MLSVTPQWLQQGVDNAEKNDTFWIIVKSNEMEERNRVKKKEQLFISFGLKVQSMPRIIIYPR